MMDYSNEEATACQNVFPSTKRLLCAFHREQAWTRWCKKAKNGLSEDQQQSLLDHLRAIARCNTSEEDLQAAIDKLQDTDVYRGSLKVQNYFNKFWLPRQILECPSENGFPVHKQFAGEARKRETPETQPESSLQQQGPSLPKKSKLSLGKKKRNQGDVFDIHIDPSLEFLVGAKLEYMSLKTNRAEFVYRGETLTQLNLATLEGRGWLDDRVINTFLAIISNDQNRGDNNHIFFIPSYMPVQWQQGCYTHLYDKVKLSAFQWVLVPINVNQAHWILMAVNTASRKVHIVDSKPDGRDTTVYVNQWRTFSRQHSEVLGIPDVVWEAGDPKSTVQTDGWNCGVFVCMNAMAIVHGVDLSRISPQHAAAFRRFILAVLHTHTLAEHLKECEVPGCVSVGKTDNSCVVCGRWAHRGCCNITRGTTYVCIICQAVYSV